MTYHEKIIVSAYTGYLMCDFSDMHEYIEKKLGRPVWTPMKWQTKTYKKLFAMLYALILSLYAVIKTKDRIE